MYGYDWVVGIGIGDYVGIDSWVVLVDCLDVFYFFQYLAEYCCIVVEIMWGMVNYDEEFYICVVGFIILGYGYCIEVVQYLGLVIVMVSCEFIYMFDFWCIEVVILYCGEDYGIRGYR